MTICNINCMESFYNSHARYPSELSNKLHDLFNFHEISRKSEIYTIFNLEKYAGRSLEDREKFVRDMFKRCAGGKQIFSFIVKGSELGMKGARYNIDFLILVA